jgi:hypothetical protein
MVFTIKYRAFRLQFSHHPILWNHDWDRMKWLGQAPSPGHSWWMFDLTGTVWIKANIHSRHGESGVLCGLIWGFPEMVYPNSSLDGLYGKPYWTGWYGVALFQESLISHLNVFLATRVRSSVPGWTTIWSSEVWPGCWHVKRRANSIAVKVGVMGRLH